ncbi:hypothetical protein CH267_06425 [Rhodococcus sp. 06-621-2]|nr:hypothetical protein CH267_06425 [Rhodococcus sp. 06-621-2]
MTDTSLTVRSSRTACVGAPSELFSPVADYYLGEDTLLAKKACQGCPVARECRRHALLSCQVFGVWGGYTPHERRSARRPRRPWPTRTEVSSR